MMKRKSGGSPGGGGGGQGESERRIEVIVKMQKSRGPVGGIRSGLRMAVYVELHLLGVGVGGLVGSKVGGSG